jgi:hypothetical protein
MGDTRPKRIRIGWWIVAIGVGVAIERGTMILFLTQASLSIKLLGGLVFLTIPIVAYIYGVRGFYRSRTQQQGDGVTATKQP